MSKVRTTRRGVLLSGLAAVSGLAGCLDVLTSGDEDDEHTTTGTTPATRTTQTTQWTPDGDDWPTVFYDAANTNTRDSDVGPAEPDGVNWTRRPTSGIPFYLSIRGSHLYVTGESSETLYALNASSGEELWSETLPAAQITTAVDGDLLYAGTRDTVHSLASSNGEEHWRQSLDVSSTGMLTPTADRLFLNAGREQTDGSVVLSLRTEQGETDWEHPTDRTIPGFALGPQRLYATTNDPVAVIVIDRETGDELWRSPDIDGWTNSPPVLDDGQVYVGGTGLQHLYAYDAANGEELWQSDIMAPRGAAPTGDGVVVGGGNGTVTLVDREDGSHHWQRELDGTLSIHPAATPSTVYSTQYIPEDSSLDGSPVYALDPDSGETEWRVQTDGRIWTAPVVTTDGLFGAYYDGTRFHITDS